MKGFLNHLSSREIAGLLAHYDTGSLKQHYLMEGGYANSSYYVQTDTGEFIMTFTLYNSFEEVKGLVDLLLHLEKNNFPTSRPIKSKEGRYILSYNGKPVILKKYIEGEVSENLSLSHLRQLGIQTVLLHKIAPQKSTRLTHEYGLETFDQLFHHQHEFIPWLKEKKEYLASHLDESMPKGIIHGDIFYDNVIVLGDKVQAIIDFENHCNGYLAFDPAMCMVGCCMNDGQLVKEKTAALLEGYYSIRPLNPVEEENLKFFVEYSAVATASWRFEHLYIRGKDEQLKSRFLKMKQVADDFHAMPNKKFLEMIFNE